MGKWGAVLTVVNTFRKAESLFNKNESKKNVECTLKINRMESMLGLAFPRKFLRYFAQEIGV
jgi:hypothetical protein